MSSLLDEDGTSKLEKLEDFRAAGEVERRLSLEVCNRLIDGLLIEEELDDAGTAEGGSNMERSVAVAVSGVDVESVLTHAQDIFDDRWLGTLDGEVQDGVAFKFGRVVAEVFVDAGRVSLSQGFKDLEQLDRLFDRRR